MTRRVFGHLLVEMIAVAAIAWPALAGAQPAVVTVPVASVAATWSWGGTIDPFTGAPSAVTCPTARFCVAVDSYGTVLVNNGKSWSSPESIDPAGGGFTSVSCPTESFCAAVDENDNAFSYDGSSWS